MPLQQRNGRPGHAPLLAGRDRFDRLAGLGRGPRLDLDEDDRAAVQRDQIEFAALQATAAGENLVAQPL